MNVLEGADLEVQFTQQPSAKFIGIRPEKIRFSNSGLAVEVSAIDYMGAETIVRLQHGRSSLLARAEGRPDLSKGDRLCVEWDPKDMHLFDQAGVRISI